MLRISSHHLPSFGHGKSPRLELSPVPSESDELIQAIEQSAGEQWTLDSTPDTRELDEFWSGVEQDLERDPTWTAFTTDEE